MTMTDVGLNFDAVIEEIEQMSSTTDKLRDLNEQLRKLPCERPIGIAGTLNNVETGELLGVSSVEFACNSAFWEVCRSCSVRHGHSAWLIGKSGISGLDNESFGAPAPIDQHFGFLTLTAPSFGPVHTQGRCRCGKYHSEHADVLHMPIDLDTYDIDGASTFNLVFTRLLNRTKTALRRRFPDARIEYFGAVEAQKRGVAHVHLVIRSAYPLDSTEVLNCASRVRIYPKRNRGGDPIRWGAQTDFSSIASNEVASDQVFKYAMKSLRYTLKDHAESTHDDISTDEWDRAHEFYSILEERAAMLRESGELAGVKPRSVNRSRGGFAGFTGHRMQKSRGWSVLSFLSLRRARAQYMNEQNDGDSSSPVVWTARGKAYPLEHDEAVRLEADRLKRDLDVLARRQRIEKRPCVDTGSVAPETRMFAPEATAASRNSAAPGVSEPFATRFARLRGRAMNLRMFTAGWVRVMSGSTTCRRDPSGSMASTNGWDRSTRRPDVRRIRSMRSSSSPTLSFVVVSWWTPSTAMKTSLGLFTQISSTRSSSK